MKVIVAPDSFKGSLSSLEVCNHIKKGIHRVFPEAEVELVPIADGGEGTVEALVMATKGKMYTSKVQGPLGQKIEAVYGILGDGETGVVELAAASGIALLAKKELNPLVTTTYGTGELIKKLLDHDCKRIVIGLGGSATNDGAAGALTALGVKFYDKEEKEIAFGGEALARIEKIDISGLDTRLKGKEIILACDVTNPLCGPTGASAVYGPQKGATKEMVEVLDRALAHFAKKIEEVKGTSILDVPGSGAAGGAAGGLLGLLEAKIQPGFPLIAELTVLEDKIKDATLVLTGEGKIDSQSIYGKTPVGVAQIAKKYLKPVIAFVGARGKGFEKVHEDGIDAVFNIAPGPITLEEAMEQGGILLEETVEQAMRCLQIGK